MKSIRMGTVTRRDVGPGEVLPVSERDFSFTDPHVCVNTGFSSVVQAVLESFVELF